MHSVKEYKKKDDLSLKFCSHNPTYIIKRVVLATIKKWILQCTVCKRLQIYLYKLGCNNVYYQNDLYSANQYIVDNIATINSIRMFAFH